MKDALTGGIIGLATGMVIGGIIVAKNKKLATKIDKGTDKIAESFEEMKEETETKIKNAKQKNKKSNKNQ